MDEEKIKAELKDFFPGIDEEAVLKCVSMCKMFNSTPENLKYKWEALTLNTATKDRPISFFTVDSARELQQQLQRDLARKGQQKPPVPKAKIAKRPFANPVMGGSSPAAPLKSGRIRPAGVKLEPSTPSLNLSTGLPVNFSPPQNLETYNYRYMHEKIMERSTALDEQIDNMAEVVRRHYGLEELGDPSSVTVDEVVVVGRIVSDGDAKLEETSTLLESSRMMGMGARVLLEFDTNLKIRSASRQGTGSTGYGLFPGMIAAFKGRNGSGDSFVVSEILRIPPLPSMEKTDSNMSLKAMIACGPFTFEADLDYRPFTAILEAAREERPDLLLLMGPFVDSNHPMIKAGRVDLTPAALFRERIAKPLAVLQSEILELLVVILPSPRDLISSHVVLPQAAIERDPELGLSRRIQLVPNPSVFSVNGFSIGATSIDVLFHIRKEEFFKQAPEIADEPNSQPADAMTMLCRQILEQQSFYPLFPVPKEVHEDVSLSATNGDLLKIKGFAPDLLVLPSRLKEFHKVVDSTVVVNPALSAKFNSAGTAVCVNVSRGTGTNPQLSMKSIKLGA